MTYKCNTCGKEYNRKDFYEKHIKTCGDFESATIIIQLTTEDLKYSHPDPVGPLGDPGIQEEINMTVESNQMCDTPDCSVVPNLKECIKTNDYIEPKVPPIISTPILSEVTAFTTEKVTHSTSPSKKIDISKESEVPKCPFCDKEVKSESMYMHKLYCYKRPQDE